MRLIFLLCNLEYIQITSFIGLTQIQKRLIDFITLKNTFEYEAQVGMKV